MIEGDNAVPWYHADKANQWPNVDDPALKHPMSPRMVQIMQVYQKLREETGKEQPLLKPARYDSPSHLPWPAEKSTPTC